MKKIFASLSIFAYLSIQAQADSQKPTLEQLINSKSVKISVECLRDEEKVNLHAWQEIVVAVNALIDLCYASDSDQVSNDVVFKEVHKTIDYVRDIGRVNADQGIHGLLTVSVGTPEDTNTNKEHKDACEKTQ